MSICISFKFKSILNLSLFILTITLIILAKKKRDFYRKRKNYYCDCIGL